MKKFNKTWTDYKTDDDLDGLNNDFLFCLKILFGCFIGLIFTIIVLAL